MVPSIPAYAVSSASQTQPSSAQFTDPPDISPQYFPNHVFGGTVNGWDQSEFSARWYSKHLRAMSEPSLLDASKDSTLVAYRFLWLRSFHNPIAIRVSIRSDGTASLTVKAASGQGGYEPGKLKVNKSFDLSTSQVSKFLALLNQSQFWAMPTELPAPKDVINLDGAQWIVEGVRDGTYHVVDRWSPRKDDDYARMCRYLVDLSKVRIPKREVY